MIQVLQRDDVLDITNEAGTRVSFGQIAELRSKTQKPCLQEAPPLSDPVDPERQRAVELIERIAAGDEAALADLYRRFAPTLFGLALKMMKDRKEAEDVLQELAASFTAVASGI